MQEAVKTTLEATHSMAEGAAAASYAAAFKMRNELRGKKVVKKDENRARQSGESKPTRNYWGIESLWMKNCQK